MENASPPPERPDGPNYGDVWDPNERTWAVLIHLSGFVGLLFTFIGNIIAPLVLWLIFRSRSDMADFHGKKALNFQISISLYGLIIIVFGVGLFFLLIAGISSETDEANFTDLYDSVAVLGAFIFAVALTATMLLIHFSIWLIWTIVAAVRASRGDPPGYILAIPFLR